MHWLTSQGRNAALEPSCHVFVQVAILYALQKGFFRNSKPEDIQGELAEALCFLRRMHPTALAEITATQSMSEPVEAAMAGVLEVLGRMPTSPVAPVNP